MMTLELESFISVEGILSQLSSNNNDIIQSALRTLVDLIPHAWSEIAEKAEIIQDLANSDTFTNTKLASLVTSKIHFHIQNYDVALHYALCAGELFDINEQSEYVQKLTEQCIDTYRQYRQRKYAFDKGIDSKEPEQNDEFDPRLEDIVMRMLKYCYDNHNYKHALGIALECRDTKHVKQSISESDEPGDMLDHCFNLCETTLDSRVWRDEVLELIVLLYKDHDVERNYTNICKCYFYLGKPAEISNILWNLLKSKDDTQILMSYQIAFDLSEYQNERFQRDIFDGIYKPPPQIAPNTNTNTDNQNTDNTNTENTNNNDNNKTTTDDNNDIEMTDKIGNNTNNTDDNNNNNTENNTEINLIATAPDNTEWTDKLRENYKFLKSILLGDRVIPLSLNFLLMNCHSDLLILKQAKDSTSERNSVLNNALMCCNGIMHSGTTIDQFLRDNLDWMGRAAHWAKFTSIATLGMIHHHNLTGSMELLQEYLPNKGGGPYQEGGSLYALGIIHCGDNSDKTSTKIRDFLLDNLINAQNEILQHGACLGLGLAALGSQNSSYLGELRKKLMQDRAVPGEASGIALGLILCGGNSRDKNSINLLNEWYELMIDYAHETQHEKIIRGLVMGIALMYYDYEQHADNVIQSLINDTDATIRYGGCYTIGLAYACTANNKAISQLLHLAVSDVSNDVRRAAVTNIGFVLANKPNQVPKVVQLLSNSYNSHVRYGAAAAIGIACAGSGNKHALEILKKLAQEDNVSYVKQASMIALGMLLQQQNNNESNEQLNFVRNEIFMKTIKSKREYTMTVMGAIYGLGIIDAGGRNVKISLIGNNNQKRMTSIIGMAMFWQYWYWYPLVPFLSLTFEPTMVMALDKTLNMPKINFKSNCPPSKFAYPEPLKEEEVKQKKKLVKVELSITTKALKRQKSLQRQKTEKEKQNTDDDQQGENNENNENNDKTDNNNNNNNNDVEMTDKNNDKNEGNNNDNKNEGENKDTTNNITTNDENNENEKKEDEKPKPEAKFELLNNPSRVTLNQRKYITWNDDRYKPVRSGNLKGKLFGVIIVQDSRPDENVEYVETKDIDVSGVHGNEPKPPKPFVYLGD